VFLVGLWRSPDVLARFLGKKEEMESRKDREGKGRRSRRLQSIVAVPILIGEVSVSE